MHVSATRSDLARVLTSVARIVEQRSTIPALSDVVLTADGNKITARGTDLDVEMSAWCDAKVTTAGVACVPAKKIADVVKAMIGETVTLELEPGVVEGHGNLIVKSGRSRFKLPSVSSKAMPTIAVDNYTHSFAANLGAILGMVDFAVGVEGVGKTTPSMEGVLLCVHEGSLRAAALNGAELATYDAPMPSELHDDMPPIRLAKRLVGLLRGIDGTAQFSVSKERLCVDTGQSTIVAKLIEGDFFNYSRVAPNENEGSVAKTNKAEFAGAVTRVALAADETRGSAIKLRFDPDTVQIVASDKDGRDAVDEAAVRLEGPPVEIGFSSPLLLGLLRAVPGDQVLLRVRGPQQFMTVTCEEDPAFYAIIAPYRI